MILRRVGIVSLLSSGKHNYKVHISSGAESSFCRNVNMKPTHFEDIQNAPNILIVTQDNEKFSSLASVLRNVLDASKYIIYQYKSSIEKSYFPSKNDTSLMIQMGSAEEGVNDKSIGFSDAQLYQLYLKGLNVIVERGKEDKLQLLPELDAKVEEKPICVQNEYKQYKNLTHNSSFVILHRRISSLEEDNWIMVIKGCFPLIKMTTSDDDGRALDLTEANIIGEAQKLNLLKERCKIKQTKMLLDFNPTSESKPTNNYLPIVETSPRTFDWNEYISHLRTKNVGRVVIHTEVVTSTFDILEGQYLCSGLAVIADTQTAGRGRSRNKWLSPEGCAMFSLQLEVSLKSKLGRRLPLIQHLVSLSVVESVKSLKCGYEKLDLRLKWPNDIYAGQNHKLGGVVVLTSIMRDLVQISIGCGVNLSNKEPSKCINQMAADQNLNPISREVLLARTFNNLEVFLDKIEEGIEEDILTLYHTYWLHGQQTVKLKSAEGVMKEGKIISLDSDGFLSVEVENDALISVHPDGNSFDMLQGLIIPKI